MEIILLEVSEALEEELFAPELPPPQAVKITEARVVSKSEEGFIFMK